MNTLSAVRRLKLLALAMKRNQDLPGLSLLADLFNVEGDEPRAMFLAGVAITTGLFDDAADGKDALDTAVTEWSISLEVELDVHNKK